MVRRHRAKAFGWVNAVTCDTFLAEDIVQDALIRAFLHLGQLSNVERFIPWLHQIVRNQAYMKLRRGGQYRKEQPFTSLRKHSAIDPGTDWGDIDQIFAVLAKSDREKARHDPEEHVLNKEVVNSIRELLHCLSYRERQIFEAHFFKQLSPQEIASLFQTTTSNVHNYISRSRFKVRHERIRVYVTGFIEKRRESGMAKKVILDHTRIRF